MYIKYVGSYMYNIFNTKFLEKLKSILNFFQFTIELLLNSEHFMI